MPKLQIQEDPCGVVFIAKIVPGSSRTAVAGVLDNMIKIKVAAPAEKGKANQCLIAFLAKRLGTKKHAVTILAGQTHPIKHVQIAGVSAETLLERLGLGA